MSANSRLLALAAPALLALASCVASAPPPRVLAPPDASRVLALVNDARARPRRCGSERHDAVPPLARSVELDRVALAHARDMAARKQMSHTGSDGSTPGERATRAGYRWRTIGENVAYGQPTAERVVAGWLESPPHCKNIMDPDYSDMGIGVAETPRGEAGPYWSQVLGRPKS